MSVEPESSRDVRVTYRVEHDTRYEYEGAVATSQHVACLRPAELPWQHTREHTLEVDPEPAERSTRFDHFGNTVEYFSIVRPHEELLVRARSVVEVRGRSGRAGGASNGGGGHRVADGASGALSGVGAQDVADRSFGDAAATPAWEEVRDAFVYRKGEPGRAEAEFLFSSPYIDVEAAARAYAAPSFAPGRPIVEAAIHLMHRMHEDFRFDPEATTVTTPVARVLEDRRGVCQDLAHVMIACLRSMALPARYVSGYLLTDPPPGQPRLVGADASHAWASVHCPGLGWVDLDPTNDVLPGLRHVVIGHGRDYGDVCPLRGVFVGAAEHKLHIAVTVEAG